MENNLRSKILAIIPAYCEAPYISDVVKGIRSQNIDVLVIDDCSTDNTGEVAEKAGATVVRHPYNLGYGVGLQTGYIYALENGYQYILQLDADSQHDPSDAQKVLDPVLQGQADLVIGSRFLEKSYKVPFSRRMGNKYFGFIAYLITGKKFSDCTSGYQAMNADVALLYSTKILPVDYPDSDVLIMLHRSGFRITEVPVLMKPSPSNKSMHSGIFKPLYYIIKMTLSILLVILRKRYSHGN